jgi:hypothetical protein
MEDVMYDPPAYLWAITIARPAAIAATTCAVLYGGAERAGLGRRRAALLAGAAAVLLGGWFTATAVIAGHGWYHTLPWFPVAVAGFLGTLLALRRIPVVARALTAPGMASRLEYPHSFRVAGVVFLFYLALGALTGFGLLNVTPSSAPITELPLALIPTATVPLLFALHITSMSTLVRAPTTSAVSRRPAHFRRHAARCCGATPGIPRPVKVPNAEEKTRQRVIDALNEAAAWPGADRRTPVVLASQLMAAEPEHAPAIYTASSDPHVVRPERR